MRRRALAFLAAVAPLAGVVEARSSPAAVQAAPAPLCQGSAGYAPAFGGRRTFLWRPQWLDDTHRRLTGDPALAEGYRSLLSEAEAALGRGPYTVIDKTRLPASGDPHDYHSIGPYWWPNEASSDGLPYVRRDGRVNPERDSDAFDTADLGAMSADVTTLALAYHLSGERRYAEHAARLLRTWFIEPDSRMNPNFNHAQAVPGRTTGRAEGVIDAHRLTPLVESIGLLAPAEVLTEADEAALRRWFGDLVAWMATSPIGRAERAKQNNHGIYYDLLISHFALFAGQEEVARHILSSFPTRRIDRQIAPDGSMPHELERTRSFHYTNWTLAAAFDLAALGECLGIDLWRYQSADGGGLRKALDFVSAYEGRLEAWPFPEMALDDADRRREAEAFYLGMLVRAAWGYQDPALAATVASNPGSDTPLTPLGLAARSARDFARNGR